MTLLRNAAIYSLVIAHCVVCDCTMRLAIGSGLWELRATRSDRSKPSEPRFELPQFRDQSAVMLGALRYNGSPVEQSLGCLMFPPQDTTHQGFRFAGDVENRSPRPHGVLFRPASR